MAINHGQSSVPTVTSLQFTGRVGLTDADLVLAWLSATPGEFVGDLYGKTHVMVHSRIADLRRRGFTIESKCFGRGDYRYRLVMP